ncbi:hypothetical protein [Longimicrobium terrae]|uniref:Uncharacterized protein n=1 Tax=Longimicrobium terrae TaxID=1639882 RepID=A0A841H500_9BACT|nr:hypothetical protein [Longimicrobium terrae]MBB4638815.1 hypothetical protein [Longimicrobium terrae]MBB6073054.1 hypothetical protein [Longimicrobium terrae]NNC33177.1 hypothetical protein [Longimicrobium terrae]
MKKLSMKVDDLRIESFQTELPIAGRGTLDAAEVSITCYCTRQVCTLDLEDAGENNG